MKQPEIDQLPEFEEMFAKTIEKIRRRELAAMPLEERLEGLTPEQVLGIVAPEQRLAGLTLEQRVAALPVEMLRGLSEDYIRSLPPEVQELVRKRLHEAAH